MSRIKKNVNNKKINFEKIYKYLIIKFKNMNTHFYLLTKKGVTVQGRGVIGRNVNIIIENGGKLILSDGFFIKDETSIYIKKNATLKIGEGTNTGRANEISVNNFIEIGSDVLIGANVYITDSNHGYHNKNLKIKDNEMDVGKVEIGNDVWIGRNVMILKNTLIGNRVVVGAGSIVTKKFGSNIIIAGNPAKIIKTI